MLEPAAIAPVARRSSASATSSLRNDLQYERFHTPRPRPTWRAARPAARGPRRSRSTSAGRRATRRHASTRWSTSSRSATPPGAPDPPPGRRVPGAGRAADRAHRDRPTRPVLVAGDGEGLVDAAAVGLLDGRRAGPLLGVVRRRPDRGSTAQLGRGRRPRAHRHATAAGRGGGAPCARTRLHRAGRREAAASTTRPTTGSTCSPTRPTTPSTVAEQRRRAPRPGDRVRQPGHLHARGPCRARPRRRPLHRVAGRRLRRPARSSGSRSTSHTPVTTDT